MTGSAYSLSIAIPTPGFTVVAGEDVAGGIDHGFGHRFCGHCLSWVFTRPPGIDAFVNVRTTMLDEVPTQPPFIETCTAEALPWVHTGAQHSFERFPDLERWGPLTEAFAASEFFAQQGGKQGGKQGN